MSTEGIQKVVLIGAGNLASHLGPALVAMGLNVVEVYNRTPQPGKDLAALLGSHYVAYLPALTRTADLYILALADSALVPLSALLQLNDKLVVHTSGTMDMQILSGVSENIGVFYPLQTFVKGRKTEIRGIPVCIEANTEQGRNQLQQLAQRLTGLSYFIDSDNRKILHLSAVVASNFTNFMYTVAEDLLLSHGLPFELLQPLISQTAENICYGKVFRYQTGPAFRGDLKVLESHRDLLKNNSAYLELYNLITQNIIKYKIVHGKLQGTS